MKKMFIIILILIIIIYIYFEVNFPKINEVLIEGQVEEEIRIIQISDVHDKKFNNSFFNRIKETDPHMIVITGDLIDRRTKDYNNAYYFIDQLNKINVPIYFVSGNHELSQKNINYFNKELLNRGVIILDEKKESFRDIDLYGFAYYSSFKDIETEENIFSIALIHSAAEIIKKDFNFNLILSGHTHGGQIRLPFIGAIFVPGQGFFAEYDKGLFDINSKTKLYIDSGLGNTFLPIRFLNKSQISLIKIYSK